ncbi:two-component system response regulator OmpR [Isoalcanivorax indicus]|uniref:osmolarity response regulator transcription factor OmpR n=1 Tax=Isoalcanivorax indicus TaxID=2202653 RepID=UPI0013C46707|nr:two-component system response regulator OmpR [Isoalcanivorax indicus]
MSADQTQDKILVVDDDARLRSLLQRFLEEQGFHIKAVGDAVQMDRALSREIYSLMVLDLMLPGEDGLSICRRLREAGTAMPIIMLTAKGDDNERIEGLEAGADDYLPKPFNPRELDARIRAVLRRQVREVPGAPSRDSQHVSFGPWALDLSRRILSRGQEEHSLTTGEFAVLKALVQHPREPLTRDKLMNLARGREWSAMERSIDVQVSRLRRLLEDDPSKPRYVQTVWGVGYVFVPD